MKKQFKKKFEVNKTTILKFSKMKNINGGTGNNGGNEVSQDLQKSQVGTIGTPNKP